MTTCGPVHCEWRTKVNRTHDPNHCQKKTLLMHKTFTKAIPENNLSRRMPKAVTESNTGRFTTTRHDSHSHVYITRTLACIFIGKLRGSSLASSGRKIISAHYRNRTSRSEMNFPHQEHPSTPALETTLRRESWRDWRLRLRKRHTKDFRVQNRLPCRVASGHDVVASVVFLPLFEPPLDTTQS